MKVWTYTEAGGHPVNEDAFAVRPHPLAPGIVMCVVADGQGGRAGGGPAARLACRTVIDALLGLPSIRLTDPQNWVSVLRVADAAVRADEVAGFTTLIGLCVVDDGQIIGASCGDSAALVVSDSGEEVLTRDQRKDPPVGSGTAVPVPFAVRDGDPRQVVVMTDGVWKYVGWQRLIDAARRERGASLIDELQCVARLPGSGRFQDDFTVVLVESAPEALTRSGETSETL